MSYLLLAGGLVALVLGAEVLVRGAVGIAARAGVPPLLVGLTIVAFGTSAPEWAVSVRAAVDGDSALALGNVLGSNVFNVLVILGVSACIRPLVVHTSVVRREVPLMLLATGVVYALILTGLLDRTVGVVLLAGLVVLTLWQIRAARRERIAPNDVDEAAPQRVPVAIAFVLGGLALLVLGAGWAVEGAVAIASALGVPRETIAATIVAGGTSLPELAASGVAAWRGRSDIAVGNVVGSNIFNLLGVLGSTLAIGGAFTPSAQALALDAPAALVTALLCLPVFLTGWRVSRREGILLLVLYGAYIALVLERLVP